MSDSLKDVTVRLDTNAEHDVKKCIGCRHLRLHHELNMGSGQMPLMAFYCHHPKVNSSYEALRINGNADGNYVVDKVPCDFIRNNHPPGWEAM